MQPVFWGRKEAKACSHCNAHLAESNSMRIECALIAFTLLFEVRRRWASHGCFNHARFGILVSAHVRYHDVALPLGLFVEELYLCVEVILKNRMWRTIEATVSKTISVVLRPDSKSIMNCRLYYFGKD